MGLEQRNFTMFVRFILCAMVLFFLFQSSSLAQTPAQRRMLRQQQELARRAQMEQKQMVQSVASNGDLPSDPQLLSLHREFITKAEKLAAEYESKKQLDRAREVYESLVRLVPKYEKAEAGLARILKSQTTKEYKITRVSASQSWQDSGATLVQGMPVYIETKGTWKVSYETGPEGIRIPPEMKPKNNQIQLGTLIGNIVSTPEDAEKPKPFVVKVGSNFTAPKNGRLFLRMFDVDNSDNEGTLIVRIQSSFGK